MRVRVLDLAAGAPRCLEAFFEPRWLIGQQHARLRILGDAFEALLTMNMPLRVTLLPRRGRRGAPGEGEEPLRAARLEAPGHPSAVDLQALRHTLSRVRD